MLLCSPHMFPPSITYTTQVYLQQSVCLIAGAVSRALDMLAQLLFTVSTFCSKDPPGLAGPTNADTASEDSRCQCCAAVQPSAHHLTHSRPAWLKHASSTHVCTQAQTGAALWAQVYSSFGYLQETRYEGHKFPIVLGETGSTFASAVDNATMEDLSLWLQGHDHTGPKHKAVQVCPLLSPPDTWAATVA